MISRPIALVMLLVCCASGAGAEESAIDQLVDVHHIGTQLIATRSERSSAVMELMRDEDVVWIGAFGNLGGAVTTRRLLVVTPVSSSWREKSLALAEGGTSRIERSSNLILLDTGIRILGFDALAGSFFEWSYPLADQVVAMATDRRVAAIVFRHQVVGYAAGRGVFGTADLQLRETLSSVSAKSELATIVTSKRVLSFRTQTASWSEERLPLH
jgi:hypothetical protein